MTGQEPVFDRFVVDTNIVIKMLASQTAAGQQRYH